MKALKERLGAADADVEANAHAIAALQAWPPARRHPTRRVATDFSVVAQAALREHAAAPPAAAAPAAPAAPAVPDVGSGVSGNGESLTG